MTAVLQYEYGDKPVFLAFSYCLPESYTLPDNSHSTRIKSRALVADSFEAIKKKCL